MGNKKINVVWCDDKIDTLFNQECQEDFERHHCALYKGVKTSDDLMSILKEKKKEIDAVIVDFNMDRSNTVPGENAASGFQWVHEHIKEYAPIPFYLYSARDYSFIETKYKDFEYDINNDYFFNQDDIIGRNRYFQPSEMEGLLNTIDREVSAIETPSFKIRNEYSKAFSAIKKFDLDSDIFLDILMFDESADRFELSDKVNPLRMVLEKLVSKLQTDGILDPYFDFNQIPVFCEKTFKVKNDRMSRALSSAFSFLINWLQDGSHNKDDLKLQIHDYLEDSGDIYILKSLAIIELDVICWLSDLFDKYKPNPLYLFQPFWAVVKEERVINKKTCIIVEDIHGRKYSISKKYNQQIIINKTKVNVIDRFRFKYSDISWIGITE